MNSGTFFQSGTGGGSAANYQLSSSCGSFSTTSTSYVDVTNLTCTITTTGGPVYLTLVPDGNTTPGNEANITYSGASNTAEMFIQFKRGVTAISVSQRETSDSGLTDTFESIPVGCLNTFDAPVAGTYTYTVQIKKGSGASSGVEVNFSKLLAYEIK